MHPILFHTGPVTLYSYGFMIALGVLAGMGYLIVAGKREVKLTFDQANTLFLYVFLAALIGGKLFLILEDTGRYLHHPEQLFSGRGFVFYGSFLLAVPVMAWFFKKNRLPLYRMLDIMAITTCLVHLFGRIGCFLAGCCYGKPTDSMLGVAFTDPACYAEPLNTPLYPTQLMEAGYILIVMVMLLFLKGKRRFPGELFLGYLTLYAAGRFVLEFFRGDAARGFLVKDYLSHSQFVALCVIAVVVILHRNMLKKASSPNVGKGIYEERNED